MCIFDCINSLNIACSYPTFLRVKQLPGHLQNYHTELDGKTFSSHSDVLKPSWCPYPPPLSSLSTPQPLFTSSPGSAIVKSKAMPKPLHFWDMAPLSSQGSWGTPSHRPSQLPTRGKTRLESKEVPSTLFDSLEPWDKKVISMVDGRHAHIKVQPCSNETQKDVSRPQVTHGVIHKQTVGQTIHYDVFVKKMKEGIVVDRGHNSA
ncbi:hypothetical protein AMATHDRAFT_46916 [Amanita thiersii Skay4041]|uniref:Uncharacterized protein n=1 Tax=Amanita thiersii Skay4041 TaxID=703135 RepID=A0A2A9NTW9_9AGAR|nr:hypothetical protein AMATHDRAFT_46916 [Amanita thiersii Skay4041]